MESMGDMQRAMARRAERARAPGGEIAELPGKPPVKVRAVYGRAVAMTPTHVLHEWVKAGQFHTRWDEKWQVQKVEPGEWYGEPFPD